MLFEDCVKPVKEGAQHTHLWGADAQCMGGGELGAKSHSLGLFDQKVLNPRVRRGSQSVQSFMVSLSRFDIFKAELNPQCASSSVLPLLQFFHCKAESYDAILYGSYLYSK